MRIRTVQLDDEQVACVALPDGRLARADRELAGAPSDRRFSRATIRSSVPVNPLSCHPGSAKSLRKPNSVW
jgi:hypothetical protein